MFDNSPTNFSLSNNMSNNVHNYTNALIVDFFSTHELSELYGQESYFAISRQKTQPNNLLGKLSLTTALE